MALEVIAGSSASSVELLPNTEPSIPIPLPPSPPPPPLLLLLRPWWPLPLPPASSPALSPPPLHYHIMSHTASNSATSVLPNTDHQYPNKLSLGIKEMIQPIDKGIGIRDYHLPQHIHDCGNEMSSSSPVVTVGTPSPCEITESHLMKTTDARNETQEQHKS